MSSEKNNGRRQRRSFTPEFRAECVRLVREEKRPVARVVEEFDLTESALRNWMRQAEVDAGSGPSGTLTTAEKEELSALRREVKALRMEKEILRKAAAFFAKEQL